MNSKKYITGIFKSHRVGFGFVKPFEGLDAEVFIPKNATSSAVEGDVVKALVLGKDSKGYEGEICEIIERKLSLIGGTVTEVVGKLAVINCPLLGPSKPVEIPQPKELKLKPGDRIQIKLDFENSEKNFKGFFEKFIGKTSDATCDTTAAVVEFNIRNSFPQAVINEVKKLPHEIIPEDYPEREDLQDLICFTIDPKTAKDFDDAITLTKEPDGSYHLGVHIADVSFFVKEGTALDQEAFVRCNSTYFPDTCISMLPKELADHLCSLKPNVPRLAVSTLMSFNKNGEMLNYRITRSIIKSQKRFSYEEVKEILDKKKKSPYLEQLKQLEELALLLKNMRKVRGCVDLALADSKIELNSEGIPEKIEIVQYDITHQMIEEFMLKNNEVIAKHLGDKNISIPYRIHEPPKEDNLKNFYQTLDTMGFKLKKNPSQADIQKIFEQVKGTHLEHQLSVNFIKCMKLAFYSPDNVGHYGLQLEHYSHFTSPIRRYVDLVLHRKLFNKSSAISIPQIAERCSDRERLSAKAESSVRTLKMLRYFKAQKKERLYTGVMTKIKHFGVFFEIPELLYEGFIHVSQLGRDYYIYNEKKNMFKGEKGGHTFKVGKPISVHVKAVDLIAQEIQWYVVKKR